ncbi:MAG: hypothetical protein ACE5G8_00725, partial [Anaerolineae bacterium]
MRLKFSWLKAALILLAGAILLPVFGRVMPVFALPPGLQEYLVLGNEYHIYRMLRSVGAYIPPLDGNQRYMASIVDITVTADDQVVYYDHWEDGYEADIFNPTQTGSVTGTLVFGDGNPLNGNAGDYTGRPNDRLKAGDSLPLSSRYNLLATGAITGYVPINPRQPTAIRFDGGDRIVATAGPVGLIHDMWPIDLSDTPPDQTWMGDSWEMYSTQALENGYSYRTPIGEDMSDTQFENVDLQIQALQNNTNIKVNNGSKEVTFVLNKGQTYSSQGYINSTDVTTTTLTVNTGTTIQADKPVQAGLVTYQNDPWSGFQDRYYNMIPDIIWGKDYVMPLPDNAADSEVYIHNPNPFTITVNAADTANNSTFTLGPASTVDYTTATGSGIPTMSGVRLNASDPFWAIAAADSNSVVYDWGYTFLPQIFLTDEYYASWAPGNVLLPPRQYTCYSNGNTTRNDGHQNGDKLCRNGSPLWVTATEDNTQVNVDYDNDGSVDETFTLNALEVRMLRDNTDFDQSGTHIWNNTGQTLAVAWGEDPGEAGTSNPNLDVGHLVLPLFQGWLTPVLLLDKTASPEILPPKGGTVTFKLAATSAFFADLSNLVITDTLPFSWTYLTGSTAITYPNNTTASFDPVIATNNGEQTLFWNLASAIGPEQTVQLKFQAAVAAPNGTGAAHFDGFESNNYSGGSGPWASNWIEEGSDNGDIKIVDNDNVTPYSGSRQLRIKDDTRTIYRAVNLSGFSQPMLRFKQYFRALEGSETFGVDISTDNGLSYTSLVSWTNPVSQDIWLQQEVDLSPYITPTARLRFRGISNVSNSDYMYLDDVEVYDRLAQNTNFALVKGFYRGHSYIDTGRATVYLSPLKLTQTAGAAQAPLGATVVYTLTYQNQSDSITGTNVVIQNTLPPGLNFAGATGGGTYDAPSRTITWNIGTLNPNTAANVTFTATLNATLPPENGDTVENTASLTSDQATVRSNSVGITVTAPDFSAAKTAPGNAMAGQVVTYTINYQNTGAYTATNTTITDTIPASTTYVQNSCGSCLTLSNSSILQWNLGAVGPGQSGSVSFAVEITATAAAGTSIQNRARYTHDSLSAPRETNSVATTVSKVTLSQSASASLVGAGQTFTVTLNYANAAAGITQTNAFIYQPIPDFTTYAAGSATNIGGVITPAYSTDGGASYQSTEPGDPADVTHLRWDVGDLSPGQNGSADFRVQVAGAGSLPNNTDIETEARLDTTESGSIYTGKLAIATVKLSLDILGPGLISQGETFTYTLRFGNTGSGAATALLSDTLPVSATYIGAWPAPGGTHPVTWSVTIPANTNNVEYTIVASVSATIPLGSELQNSAALNSAQQSTGDTLFSYIAQPGVSLIPNNSDSGHQADTLCYAHTVFNNSPISDTINLTATHSVWSGATGLYHDVNASRAFESGTDTPLVDTNADTLRDTGLLNPGSLLRLLACVPIPTNAEDGSGNATTLQATSVATPTNFSRVTDSSSVLTGPGLATRLTTTTGGGPLYAGNPVTYTLTITNSDNPPGATYFTHTNLIITGTAPAGMTFVPGSGTIQGGGSITVTATAITATVPALGLNQTLTLRWRAGVAPSAPTGNIASTTYADSDQQGTPAAATVNNAVEAGLTSRKYAADLNGPPLVISDTIRYTIVVTNTDAANSQTNVTIYDTLPVSVTFVGGSQSVLPAGTATYLGGPHAISATVPTLGAQKVATVTFDVTLNPDTAGQTITNTAAISSNEQPNPVPPTPVCLDGSFEPCDPVVPTTTLTLAKSAADVNGGTLAVSDTLRYTLRLTNTGAYTAFNVTVTDALPGGVTFAGSSADRGNLTGSSALTWTISELASSGAATAVITATVNRDQAGQTITNTATTTAANSFAAASGSAPVTVTNACQTDLTGWTEYAANPVFGQVV